MRRFIIRIFSHDYGSWEVLRSTICKPGNQECPWCNLVQVWGPESQECQCLRAIVNGCSNSSKKSKFALPLSFCSIQTVSGLGDAHLLWWRWSLLILLIQILISSGNTSQAHTKIMSYHPLLQSSWHINVPIKFTRDFLTHPPKPDLSSELQTQISHCPQDPWTSSTTNPTSAKWHLLSHYTPSLLPTYGMTQWPHQKTLEWSWNPVLLSALINNPISSVSKS